MAITAKNKDKSTHVLHLADVEDVVVAVDEQIQLHPCVFLCATRNHSRFARGDAGYAHCVLDLRHGIELTDTNWRSIDKAYYRYRKALANERHLMENL